MLAYCCKIKSDWVVYINICYRPELSTHTSKCLEVIEEEPEVDVESGEEMITSEEEQSVLETELHTSPSEKLSEKEVRWFLIITVFRAWLQFPLNMFLAALICVIVQFLH